MKESQASHAREPAFADKFRQIVSLSLVTTQSSDVTAAVSQCRRNHHTQLLRTANWFHVVSFHLNRQRSLHGLHGYDQPPFPVPRQENSL